MFYDPNVIENQMAILTSNCLPKVCAFPLVTRAGDMDVKVDGVDSIIQQTFTSWLSCWTKRPSFFILLLKNPNVLMIRSTPSKSTDESIA